MHTNRLLLAAVLLIAAAFAPAAHADGPSPFKDWILLFPDGEEFRDGGFFFDARFNCDSEASDGRIWHENYGWLEFAGWGEGPDYIAFLVEPDRIFGDGMGSVAGIACPGAEGAR